MDLQLKDDVAAIVGAAKGIGLAIAEAFAAAGASVALVDREPAVVQAAAELTKASGARCEGLVADVTDYAAVQRAAAQVDAALGGCQHVVYAAAVGSGKFGFPFWSLAPQDWDRVLRVNLIGAVNVAHAFAPGMTQARRGTFLWIASIAGQIGSQTDPPYSASKAALINFSQCAAKDLAPYQVRVNCLCPGMVETALNQSVWQSWNDRQAPAQQLSYGDWAAEKIRHNVPLNRWQDARDMADMAVFLASPRAKNVTGQTINVDGGQVMHW